MSFNIPFSPVGYPLVMPSSQGAGGTVLQNNGSGLLSWVNVSSEAVTSIAGDGTTIVTSPTTITSTGTISIASGYVGQNTITTLGTLTTGVWNSTNIPLNHGGTNASLTAVAGGIIYSTASAFAVLNNTSASGRILMSGATVPAWSTATYPINATANNLLYGISSAGFGSLATANNGTLVTSGTGVPSISSTLPAAVQANITATGIIATGQWESTTAPIGATYGGTGVNNGSNTLSLAGTLATAGAFASTFTMTGATIVTFPTSGTLATTSQLPSLPLSLANGGLAQSNTASNGGIFYSTASAGAILAGTATANQMLLSGALTTPVWSTVTHPATTTINQILYSSSANVLSGLATANNATLITSAAGVPSISATLPAAVQGNITGTGIIVSGQWQSTTAPIGATYGGTGVNNGANTLTLAGTLATAGAFATTFTMTSATSVTFPTSGTLATTSQLPSLPLSLTNGGTNASLTAALGAIPYSTASAMAFLAPTATAHCMLLSGNDAAPIWSTSKIPVSAGTTANVPLVSDGTNYALSAIALPASTTINTLLYSSAANVISTITVVDSAVLVTSAGGVPSLSTTLPAVSGANLTGTASSLTAGNVTTNANLTGPITSVGNATAVTNLAITNAMIANSTIDLTAKVANALPIANGGTGRSVQVVCMATNSTNQSIPSGTQTVVTFNTAIVQTVSGIFSSGTGKFTIPTGQGIGNGGYYLITANASTPSAISSGQIAFWCNAYTAGNVIKNNSRRIGALQIEAPTAANCIYSVSGLAQLDEGDYIQFWCYQQSGSSINIGETSNADLSLWFTISGANV